jgi:hypothetical protein
MGIYLSSVIDKSFLDAFKSINFIVKEKTKNSYKFIYMNNQYNIFRISKITYSNEVHFYLSKRDTKFPAYPIGLIVRTKGNDDEKRLFEYCTDYYLFDNEEELLGIFCFDFDILRRFAHSFFCGNLDKEIDMFFKEEGIRKKEKYKEFTKEEKYRMGHEMAEEWRRIRFPVRLDLLTMPNSLGLEEKS